MRNHSRQLWVEFLLENFQNKVLLIERDSRIPSCNLEELSRASYKRWTGDQVHNETFSRTNGSLRRSTQPGEV